MAFSWEKRHSTFEVVLYTNWRTALIYGLEPVPSENISPFAAPLGGLRAGSKAVPFQRQAFAKGRSGLLARMSGEGPRRCDQF